MVVSILDKTYLEKRVDASITETEKTQNIQNMLLYEILMYTKAMAPKEDKNAMQGKCEAIEPIPVEVEDETVIDAPKGRKTIKGRK